jgi:molybdopterin-guanine dinucleotide biosynthesis protein A
LAPKWLVAARRLVNCSTPDVLFEAKSAPATRFRELGIREATIGLELAVKGSVAGAILAGGKGKRIGGAKAMALLLGRPLVTHVDAVLRPHVEALAVVGDQHAAIAVGGQSITDEVNDAPGPLVGILASLEWAATIGAEWVVICPCDTPLLPGDLVARLLGGVEQSGLSFAESPGGAHPLVSAWRIELRERLRAAMAAGHPAARDIMKQFGAAPVRFEDDAAFLNVNAPSDLAEAEKLLLLRAELPSQELRRS